MQNRHAKRGCPTLFNAQNWYDCFEGGGFGKKPWAFVTDSNRPQPFWQPPPTACLTAAGAASEAPSLLMHPWVTVREVAPYRVPQKVRCGPAT